MGKRNGFLVAAAAALAVGLGLFVAQPASSAGSARIRPPRTTTTAAPTTTKAAVTTTTVVTTTTPATTTTKAAVTTTTAPPVNTVRCVVRLHGKGGDGFATYNAGGWLEVGPRGNAAGWGAWQWMYFPESSYNGAVAVVANAISANRCTRVVIDGFSNGAAFAAKLACRGATFGGTVVGYVIDDPVPDHGTDGCGRIAPAVLYWTGALADTATPGWICAWGDWTCEGGETIGIALTASHLALPVTPSIWTSHSPYSNPPELSAWLK